MLTAKDLGHNIIIVKFRANTKILRERLKNSLQSLQKVGLDSTFCNDRINLSRNDFGPCKVSYIVQRLPTSYSGSFLRPLLPEPGHEVASLRDKLHEEKQGLFSGGYNSPGIHQLLVCLAVPRKCNFSRNFFFQIAIRILRKVDATSTVFVTFQLPQIQRGTFCLFSILTFCLITDRRIRPLINYKPPLPPNSGKSLGICRVRVHLVILNQCMVLYIIISPSGMEVVLFFF